MCGNTRREKVIYIDIRAIARIEEKKRENHVQRRLTNAWTREAYQRRTS